MTGRVMATRGKPSGINEIIAELQQGKRVTVSTGEFPNNRKEIVLVGGKKYIVFGPHEYVLLYNSNSGNVMLFNPHDGSSSVEITPATLSTYIDGYSFQ
jgi:hypothetical protein